VNVLEDYDIFFKILEIFRTARVASSGGYKLLFFKRELKFITVHYLVVNIFEKLYVPYSIAEQVVSQLLKCSF